MNTNGCRNLRLTGLLALLAAAPLLAGEHYDVVVERGAAATMRDGAVLRGDIYRPKAEGKFPVLLERTPYDKRMGPDAGFLYAAQGYVVIIQDVRGRFSSEGSGPPYGMSPRTVTTRWSGRPRFPTRTARWECLEDRTWGLRRCCAPWQPRLIWPASTLL